MIGMAQALAVDRLVQLAKTKVSWDKAAHRDMLARFWEGVYVGTPMPEPSLNVNVSPGWKDMGFQSNDPCTDFRAMGLLGLHCLHYHATKYPPRVRSIVHAGKPHRDFPYAAVGINLVAALVQMLKLGQAGGQTDVEGTALFEFFCKMPIDECVEGADTSMATLVPATLTTTPTATPTATLTATHTAPSTLVPSYNVCGGGGVNVSKEKAFAFEETFCAVYEMLDDMWIEDPPANILFFNTLLQQCRSTFSQLVDSRCVFSLPDLQAAIRNYVPPSELQPLTEPVTQPPSAATLGEPVSGVTGSLSEDAGGEGCGERMAAAATEAAASFLLPQQHTVGKGGGRDGLEERVGGGRAISVTGGGHVGDVKASQRTATQDPADETHCNMHVGKDESVRALQQRLDGSGATHPDAPATLAATFAASSEDVASTRCNALQHAATHCITLQHTTTHAAFSADGTRVQSASERESVRARARVLKESTSTWQTVDRDEGETVVVGGNGGGGECGGQGEAFAGGAMYYVPDTEMALQHAATHCNTLQHTFVLDTDTAASGHVGGSHVGAPQRAPLAIASAQSGSSHWVEEESGGGTQTMSKVGPSTQRLCSVDRSMVGLGRLGGGVHEARCASSRPVPRNCLPLTLPAAGKYSYKSAVQ